MGGKPKKLALKVRSELLLSKFWSAHSRSTSDTRERRYIYTSYGGASFSFFIHKSGIYGATFTNV